MAVKIRKAGDRGYFDYDWLKTYHTFSFGDYQDPQYMSFRSLRVINENRVKPAVGFPLHSQRNMEIFSIVLEGGLAHQDDMGNGSILRPGHVQLMSAGTGVTHTETNASDKREVHFLQVWILPDQKALEPSYQEQYFSDSEQHNRWCLIISKDGREGSLKIHQDVSIFLTQLDEDTQLTQNLDVNRYGWLQILKGTIELSGQLLEPGDGASISEVQHLEIKALTPAHLLFFDLN